MQQRKKKRKGRVPLHDFFMSKSDSSQIQELRVADDIGGDHIGARRVGRMGDKADVESSRFLVDAKLTEKKSFALSEKVLAKIDKEALAYGKIPAIALEYTNFRFGVTNKWAVIPYDVFVQLVRDKEKGE